MFPFRPRFRFLGGAICAAFRSIVCASDGTEMRPWWNTCRMHVRDDQTSCSAAFAIAPPAMYLSPDAYQSTAFIMLPAFLFEKAKRPRSTCQYSVTERAVMDPFKDKYRRANNKDERKHIFRSDILPAIFNHWTDNGKVSVSIEYKKEQIEARIASILHIISYSWLNSEWGDGLPTIGGRMQQKRV